MTQQPKTGKLGYVALSGLLIIISTTANSAKDNNISPIELQANKQQSIEILKAGVVAQKKKVQKDDGNTIIITRDGDLLNSPDHSNVGISPTEELHNELEGIVHEHAAEQNNRVSSSKIVGLSVKEVQQPEPEKVSILMEQAYEMLNQGLDEMAIHLYKKAIKQDPDNITAMFGLAATYQKNMQLPQARSVYNKLLKQDPYHKAALKNYMSLIARDNPRTAINTLQELSVINPQYAPVHAQIGKLYINQGNKEAAIAPLVRAIQMEPNSPEHRYRLAVTLDKLNQHKKAAKLYMQTLQLYNKGQTLPITARSIQERITYIKTYQN
jgi:tetratricopeptide (TPR) repeat protein